MAATTARDIDMEGLYYVTQDHLETEDIPGLVLPVPRPNLPSNVESSGHSTATNSVNTQYHCPLGTGELVTLTTNRLYGERGPEGLLQCLEQVRKADSERDELEVNGMVAPENCSSTNCSHPGVPSSESTLLESVYKAMASLVDRSLPVTQGMEDVVLSSSGQQSDVAVMTRTTQMELMRLKLQRDAALASYKQCITATQWYAVEVARLDQLYIQALSQSQQGMTEERNETYRLL
ncbi:hypothetical protein BD309DRAFT_968818 [Dichomitus squalens]|nr:hypothetical protein BD309DRAFT_968818 [Dichomitus squalens]